MVDKVVQKVYFLLLIMLIGIVAPLLLYYVNFKDHGLSSSPSNWAAFGDYVGGLVNPVIGVASLGILGYISLLLGKYSTVEQKALFYEEQRILAYQELIYHFTEYKKVVESNGYRATILDKINAKVKGDDEKQFSAKEILDLYDPIYDLNSFNMYLQGFGVKFRKIFKYDFGSETHTNTINKVDKMIKIVINRVLDQSTENEEELRIESNKLLTEFVTSLYNELN